jgi:hypothetical protein
MEYKMVWEVRASRRTFRMAERMPNKAWRAFLMLKEVLVEFGPTGPHAWRNYGKLKGDKGRYHCHLTPDHQWVACWRQEKGILVIEIEYAGSHQSAPY